MEVAFETERESVMSFYRRFVLVAIYYQWAERVTLLR